MLDEFGGWQAGGGLLDEFNGWQAEGRKDVVKVGGGALVERRKGTFCPVWLSRCRE